MFKPRNLLIYQPQDFTLLGKLTLFPVLNIAKWIFVLLLIPAIMVAFVLSGIEESRLMTKIRKLLWS
jgi:hypothetical protein